MRLYARHGRCQRLSDSFHSGTSRLAPGLPLRAAPGMVLFLSHSATPTLYHRCLSLPRVLGLNPPQSEPKGFYRGSSVTSSGNSRDAPPQDLHVVRFGRHDPATGMLAMTQNTRDSRMFDNPDETSLVCKPLALESLADRCHEALQRDIHNLQAQNSRFHGSRRSLAEGWPQQVRNGQGTLGCVPAWPCAFSAWSWKRMGQVVSALLFFGRIIPRTERTRTAADAANTKGQLSGASRRFA
jgi:hypothetical protein